MGESGGNVVADLVRDDGPEDWGLIDVHGARLLGVLWIRMVQMAVVHSEVCRSSLDATHQLIMNRHRDDTAAEFIASRIYTW